MSQESRKLWARTGVCDYLGCALEDVRQAQKYAGPLPAKLRRRLDRLAGDMERLRAEVRAWPITQEERARADLERR